VKPRSFQYHAPQSTEEVVDLLSEFGDDAKVIAGGQSLVPLLAMRLASFDHLVDIRRLGELKGIEERNGEVSVGAGVTQVGIERNEVVRSAVPLLARATPLIGHFQIRNRGTIGGSVCHADPAAEYPAVALALDARMEVLGPRGRRTIPATEFFTGLWSTALGPEELLVGVTFPVWGGRPGFGVQEFARRHGDFALAGATVGVQVDGQGRVERCAVGLIGLGSTPERAREAEAQIIGVNMVEVSGEELGRLAMSNLESVPSDLHGSASYRKKVGAEMVARAWMAASREAISG
jgi:carbon-monoxide dehydrogenase medium subunit